MDGIMSFVRLGRTGGTTDADLRTCVRFVFCRPGWSVEEVAGEQGETHLRLRTRCGAWRIIRAEGRLVLVGEGSVKPSHDVGTMQEALILAWEADQGAASVAGVALDLPLSCRACP